MTTQLWGVGRGPTHNAGTQAEATDASSHTIKGSDFAGSPIGVLATSWLRLGYTTEPANLPWSKRQMTLASNAAVIETLVNQCKPFGHRWMFLPHIDGLHEAMTFEAAELETAISHGSINPLIQRGFMV